MTGSAIVLAGMLCGALLEVQTVPWSPETSVCFLADTTLDGRAEVCVLDAGRLRVYSARQRAPLFDVQLAPQTSAVDIADIDGDGTADVVTVRGEAIRTYPLAKNSEGQDRFTLENRYSHVAGRPFPTVLVVERDGTPMAALPREEGLEIRDFAGNLVEHHPVGLQTPSHRSITRPFTYWVSQHAQAGPRSALEFRISSVVSYQPLDPAEAAPVPTEPPAARLGTRMQQHEAAGLDPSRWPWFSVGDGPAGRYRALYRAASTGDATTAIRIRTTPDEDASGSPSTGPARHYPGALILREGTAPDFNGDGFADILLWKAQQPAVTANALVRAAAGDGWPVRLTAHLFVPDKRRFSPKPAAHLTVKAPLAWWFSRTRFGPLREILLHDFNGDGRTDLGCLTRDDTLAVWTSDEEGFTDGPAFEHQFPDRVERVVFQADLEGQGRTSVGIESGDALHILRPWSPLSEF